MSDKKQPAEQAPDMDFDLSTDELKQIITDKTMENAELHGRLAKAQEELVAMTKRTLRVHEENQLLKADPEISRMKARLDYELLLAASFIKSGAFPKSMTPEQAFTIMRAGREMGLKDVEALNSLYIVNGAIKPWGKFKTSVIRKAGFRIEYLNESKDGVTVRVTNKTTDEVYEERVNANDPIFRDSRAYNMSPSRKMRYHGLDLILTFHLAQELSSVSDFFSDDASLAAAPEPKTLAAGADQKERDRLVNFIGKATTQKQLSGVWVRAVELGLDELIQAKSESLPQTEEE